MHLTNEQKQEPDWPVLIKEYRLSLNLSRQKFGKIYGVTRATVFYWETARHQAPYQVTWDVLRHLEEAR